MKTLHVFLYHPPVNIVQLVRRAINVMICYSDCFT